MIKIKLEGIEEEFKRMSAAFEKQSLDQPIAELVKELVAATPVDTGFARESWSVRGNVVSNTAAYIERLNSGSSKQAPAYFVEETCLKHGRAIGMIVEVRPDR